MKHGRIFCWVLLVFFGVVVLVSFQHALTQESAAELYEAAVFKKESEGDLSGAIQILLRIIKEFPENRKIAARAQLQIGICYEKLGIKEAKKAYQSVVDNYPDQVEEVNLAKKKLASFFRAKTDEKELKIRKVLEGHIVVYSSVSPNGRYYAYPDEDKYGNFAVRDLTTGESRILTEDKGGFAYDATWSPDGKNLAYVWTDWSDVNASEIRVAGMDGSGSRIIFKKKKGVYAYPFDWTPDGKHILAYFTGEPLSSDDESVELGLVSIEDGSFHILKTFKLTESFQSFMLIKEGYFSPGGRSIAYTKEVRSGQSVHHDIFLFSLDEKKEIPLVKHPADEYLLGWSPDGKHVLFASNRTGTIGVWAIRVSEQRTHKDPVLIKDNMGPIIPLGVTDKGAFFLWSQE